MSRNDLVPPPLKRRPPYLLSLAWVGALVCAGLFGTYAPASADSFSHLPTIDVYPTVNYATGNDEYGSPGGPDPTNNFGPPIGNIVGNCPGCAAGGTRPGKLDINFGISIPIVKSLAFSYNHGRAAGIDTTIGRVTNSAGQYIYPKTSNDIVDTFSLGYSGIKGVGITFNTFYRFRHDNEATDDPLNLSPADWHEQNLQLSYTAPPIAALNGLTLGVSGTGEYNHHHVSGNPNLPLFNADGSALRPGQPNYGSGLEGAALAGYSDQDGKKVYGINYGFNANLPINHGLALFGDTNYGAFDFFDNSPVPFYYVIDEVGLTKKFNKTLSLTSVLNNLTQINRGGVPFVYPNTIHRIYFSISADIHISQ